MNLYRIPLRVLSPWRTPWQADTLTGSLLNMCARVHGAEFLRERLIAPMLEGKPPFVLSDACPRDLLPAPMTLRQMKWDAADFKRVKKATFLPRPEFDKARAGQKPALPDKQPWVESFRHHNTLSRLDNTSLEGGLFNLEEWTPANGNNGVDLYARARDAETLGLLLDLLHELSLTGFGADASTGSGRFEISAEPETAADLEGLPGADGVVSLSTFQPGPDDPRDGLWEAFPKFGKLGPDLGVSDARKNTLMMFRPGACLKADPATRVLGRAVPMNELLPDATAARLTERDIEVIHPAFALTIPVRINP